MAPDTAVAEKEIIEELQLKEKLTNEEYKIWKKLVPLLYDTIRSVLLDYPSLIVQWLGDYSYSDNKNLVKLRYLYGTNTLEKGANYLKLGEVALPLTLAPDFATVCPNADLVPIPLSQLDVELPFSTVNRWKVPRELNRLRVLPDEARAVAIDGEGIVHLFDLGNYDQLTFRYHKLEGQAVEWVDSELFLTGALDFHIALWDVAKPLTPIQLFKSHDGPINDLSLLRVHPLLFASVLDDYTTQWHDIRDKSSTANPAIKVTNPQMQMAVAVHPELATVYATAGRDNVVLLFDLRNPNQAFRELHGHTDTVIGVRWDTHNDPMQLLLWALDKRVITWDLERLDTEFVYPTDEQQQLLKRGKQSATKADPCLKFIHAGHTNRVNDVGIHPKVKGIYALVGEDNLLEVWKPKTLIERSHDEE